MKHPEKWRDTCNPFALEYQEFRPVKILGYPHAGNDVFHTRGIYRGKEICAYIKVARQTDTALENERMILQYLDHPAIPHVLDFGWGTTSFLVTEEIPGQRLSVILEENGKTDSIEYMKEYGETLARIHQMKPVAQSVADRRFFHTPSVELLKKLDLAWLSDFFTRKPRVDEKVFCHGDFHYANILWKDHHISGILDFELSGWGNREFDIAWALILRPGQEFLKTEEERNCFFQGYQKYGDFDKKAVQYYMAQIYVYFLSFSDEDIPYCQYVRSWLSTLV